ncbi:MAG: phenylacetate-CoA oxygenase subunit PaaJ [Sphingobacteriaceae bacterium]|nr:phenylacetate-CoA oxygenase subunit PaaJ [Sphingobacteriaceae bacterium]
MKNLEDIRAQIESIPDPEIPVISIRELGILRNITFTDSDCHVTITPTYNGCPAMGMIEDQIKEILNKNGITNYKVDLVYTPAWTTDWITTEAKEKLRVYGIAPPTHSSCLVNFEQVDVACPRCSSHQTSLISKFGSTACKALYKCNSCEEPFDLFKCH